MNRRLFGSFLVGYAVGLLTGPHRVEAASGWVRTDPVLTYCTWQGCTKLRIYLWAEGKHLDNLYGARFHGADGALEVVVPTKGWLPFPCLVEAALPNGTVIAHTYGLSGETLRCRFEAFSEEDTCWCDARL